MAIEPAAISAKPATTMIRVVVSAPDNPAASANGTVSPSAIPITISRTNSDAVKCFSTCGVCGIFFQVSPSVGIGRSRNLLGSSLGYNLAAAIAALGSHVDHPICAPYDIEVVLDDQDTAAVLDQPLERGQQFGDVVEVQAGGRLVENVERATASCLRKMRRQLHSLGFTAAQRCGRLSKAQITEADVRQNLQLRNQALVLRKEGQSFLHRQLQNFVDVQAAVTYVQNAALEARAFALFTHQLHVGE